MTAERNLVSTEPAAAPVPPADVADNLLREYESAKFELAGLLREADAAARQAKLETLQAELQSLIERLAEDRFYLTLAGQFSRGKTTLLNAMLGMERLPTGVVPVTSVITAVSHNARERVVLHFQNSNLSREIPLSELSGWITEQANPGNSRRIEMAEVQLPSELLRRGAFFVDTPGLGSAVLENTATTHRFLPQIDALVLVTSFEVPLSSDELLFLSRARALGRKLFVVVNKLDLCTPAQQQEVVAFIRSHLADQELPDPVPLFPLSASQALAARLTGDQQRLEQSGLPALEQALVSYLLQDRYNDFLAIMYQRLASVLADAPLPVLRSLAERLQEMRAKRAGQAASARSTTAARAAAARRSLTITSCFICRRMAAAAFEFLSRFQYDLSHSLEEQLLHAGRSGFCKLHTREYARLASPQGIASGYPRTLFFLAERLRLLAHNGGLREDWRQRFDQLLPREQNCRVCRVESATEEIVVRDFLNAWKQSSAEGENGLPCVCLGHLRAILQKEPASGLANRLLSHAAGVLESTAENMERFALRQGGLHRELITDEESAAPERGLNLLVGQPNVGP